MHTGLLHCFTTCRLVRSQAPCELQPSRLPPAAACCLIQGLEKYVMSKVWRQTFAVWQEDRERDERYQRLMQVCTVCVHSSSASLGAATA